MSDHTTVEVEPRQVTDDEVEHFREAGWAVLRGLVTPDCAASMLREAKRLMGEHADGEVDGKQYADFGWWKNYHYPALKDEIEPFRSVVFSPTMRHNMQRLAKRPGMDIRYFVDELACKMPEGTGIGTDATGWHQDLPHYPHDRVGHVGFWLALDEIPPERGTLRFITGSHREGPLGRDFGLKVGAFNSGEKHADALERYPEVAERYEVSPPIHLQPGDATCHGGLTLHSAPANTTSEPRWAYIFTYFPADVLFNGAYHSYTADLDLEVNRPFDHPRFPLIPDDR